MYPYNQPKHAQDSYSLASQQVRHFSFFVFIVFLSQPHRSKLSEKVCAVTVPTKNLRDTSACSEMKPPPAASQQNQSENMTLTAAGSFNIFIMPACCSSRLVSVSISNTDFMHLWLGSRRSIQTVSWHKTHSTGKEPPTLSVANYNTSHKGLKFA